MLANKKITSTLPSLLKAPQSSNMFRGFVTQFLWFIVDISRDNNTRGSIKRNFLYIFFALINLFIERFRVVCSYIFSFSTLYSLEVVSDIKWKAKKEKLMVFFGDLIFSEIYLILIVDVTYFYSWDFPFIFLFASAFLRGDREKYNNGTKRVCKLIRENKEESKENQSL